MRWSDIGRYGEMWRDVGIGGNILVGGVILIVPLFRRRECISKRPLSFFECGSNSNVIWYSLCIA